MGADRRGGGLTGLAARSMSMAIMAALAAAAALVLGLSSTPPSVAPPSVAPPSVAPLSARALESRPLDYGGRLAAAAADRVGRGVLYDGAYRRIAYPMGDVAPDRGVCTDLVIRAYRALGVDLQEKVHLDMRRAFRRYPKAWGLRRPDPNIDHRRVLNLETYFARAGAKLPPSDDPKDYRPGDLVSYRLADGRPHIAVVSDRIGHSGRPMIVHNIGWGPSVDDTLFAYRIIGRFRYRPQS